VPFQNGFVPLQGGFVLLQNGFVLLQNGFGKDRLWAGSRERGFCAVSFTIRYS
jgi:hypothetical protein